MPDRKGTVDIDTRIETLGAAKIETPLPYGRFVGQDETVLINLAEDELDENLEAHESGGPATCYFQKAGPREHLYFDPSKAKCAIVTCGGLCPGINDVIRAIVMEAFHNYNVRSVTGIPFGLQGFVPKYGHDLITLTPDSVSSIHQFGGTILGSSRGPQPPEEIVDMLERHNISILFMIGGDGTMRAAQQVVREIQARSLKISVIGIPKTIDNDINFVTKSFGFDTAVEKATEAIQCAHVEATGADNGIGLVKVMGRESGFIAAQAALALKEVNIVLVPECPFDLEGEHGLFAAIRERLEARHHCVILCAEGAGQHLCEATAKKDPSGNPVLCDICEMLIKRIKDYFWEQETSITLKYIDPSYIIRSVPANSNDRVYCGFLGQNAVHAAMAGKTSTVISQLQSRYVHLPLHLVTRKRKKLNTNSEYWRAVVESTGQRILNCATGAFNGLNGSN